MSKIQRIIATVFLVAGVVMLCVGVYMLLVPAIPAEYVGETQATITDIAISYDNARTTGTDSRRDVNHTVMIAYEVDGKEYKRELGSYSTGMYTGQILDIQYDTREPGRITLPGSRMIGGIIVLALGAVFAGLGVFLMIKPVPVYLNGRQVA